MEILQHSLNGANYHPLNGFQTKVWSVIQSLLKKLITNHLSDESRIEKGLGLDVFLHSNAVEFILYFSITENCLYINSKYFDIYIYSETSIEKIECLSKEILLGNYLVALKFDRRDRLVSKEVTFDKQELREFNESSKFGLFIRNPEKKVILKGHKFINE